MFYLSPFVIIRVLLDISFCVILVPCQVLRDEGRHCMIRQEGSGDGELQLFFRLFSSPLLVTWYFRRMLLWTASFFSASIIQLTQQGVELTIESTMHGFLPYVSSEKKICCVGRCLAFRQGVQQNKNPIKILRE